MPSKKAKKRPFEAAAERPEASAAAAPALRSWLERHSLAVALALILIATLRIVSTYTVFNHTSDEPNHIACGMEWLDKGTYTYETQHPPLARIAAALGPFYWASVRRARWRRTPLPYPKKASPSSTAATTTT